MTYRPMENIASSPGPLFQLFNVARVGGMLEVKVVVKEKLDALEGGVQHI